MKTNRLELVEEMQEAGVTLHPNISLADDKAVATLHSVWKERATRGIKVNLIRWKWHGDWKPIEIVRVVEDVSSQTKRITVPMPVLQGIEYVRKYGCLNSMLDIKQVVQLCRVWGCEIAANWILRNKEQYMEGIGKGFQTCEEAFRGLVKPGELSSCNSRKNGGKVMAMFRKKVGNSGGGVAVKENPANVPAEVRTPKKEVTRSPKGKVVKGKVKTPKAVVKKEPTLTRKSVVLECLRRGMTRPQMLKVLVKEFPKAKESSLDATLRTYLHDLAVELARQKQKICKTKEDGVYKLVPLKK